MGKVHILMQNLSAKGHNFKNISGRVMGYVDYDVDFNGEYIFQVSKLYLK
jgi:hypothetical protein